MLLSLTGFHLILFMFMLLGNRASRVVNEELFAFKILAIIGGVVGLCFVPNRYLSLVPLLAQYPAVLYLIYQNICLLDMGFRLSDFFWVKNIRKRTSFYAVWMCFFFVFCVFVAVVSQLINWLIFWISGCKWNKWTLISSSVTAGVLILVGFVPIRERVHFITGAWMAMLFAINTGSTLASTYETDCNPLDRPYDANAFFSENRLRLIIDLGLAFVSMSYSSFTSTTSQVLTDAHLSYMKAMESSSLDISRSLDEGLDEEKIKVGLRLEFQRSTFKYTSGYFTKFHSTALLFTTYLLCLFFEWGEIEVYREELWGGVLLGSPVAFYAKGFAGVVMVLFYLWVTILPRIIGA